MAKFAISPRGSTWCKRGFLTKNVKPQNADYQHFEALNVYFKKSRLWY